MIKKPLIFIISCIFCFVVIPSLSADPAVIIYSYSLSPEVFMPGDSGTLTLTIKNAETTNTVQSTSTSGTTTTVRTDTIAATLNNVWIVYATDGTHKVKATLNYEDVGELAPGTSINLNFKIIAEENISEDLYFPTARIDVSSYEDVTYPIPIKVSNATVDLLLTDVPSRISRSGSTLVTLTAVNSRENAVEGVTIIPQSTEGIEFTPNSVYVGSLEADTSSEASFSIKPSNVGDYNISFTVLFKNGDNIHTAQISHTVEVVETSDVAPVFVSVPSSLEQGESTRVSLEIYNAKTESITGVIVTPITKAVVSPSQYFIGSMDPDDVFSASFDISTGDLSYGNYSLGFKVSFKQDNEYYETPTISSTLTIIPQENTRGNSPFLVLIGSMIIIILVIMFFVFYIKKRRITK
jgi:hypothetical protein